MNPTMPDILITSLEQQLVAEEKKFEYLLKQDVEFHILKEVRKKIRQLRTALGEHKLEFKN
jgi:hypothetical protein